MKTSVIEMRDILTVLTVDEVEERISKVPGVESARPSQQPFERMAHTFKQFLPREVEPIF